MPGFSFPGRPGREPEPDVHLSGPYLRAAARGRCVRRFDRRQARPWCGWVGRVWAAWAARHAPAGPETTEAGLSSRFTAVSADGLRRFALRVPRRVSHAAAAVVLVLAPGAVVAQSMVRGVTAGLFPEPIHVPGGTCPPHVRCVPPRRALGLYAS